jgi:hypothetical protein
MSRAVLAFAAASAMLGCSKPDAVWSPGRQGAISVEIAAEQSNLCHPDCSTEALQVSGRMSFDIGHLGDGGFPEGPVGPGVYQGPPAPDGGTGVVGWQVGGVCDQVGIFPVEVSGTVTLTHVPSNPSERLEGFYNVDPSGAQYGFTSGSFSAHTCP